MKQTTVLFHKTLQRIKDLITFKTHAPQTPPHGWILSADWLNNTNHPVEYFAASWIVPNPPENPEGQLIYLFHGIQDVSGNDIVQCVLQWGKSEDVGGDKWIISSIYAESAAGDPIGQVAVFPGDQLNAVIKRVQTNTNQYVFELGFENYPDTQTTCAPTVAMVKCVVVLEAYSITSADQYPDADSTIFNSLKIVTNQQVSPVWNLKTEPNTFGLHVESNDSQTVALYYRQATGITA